MAQTIAMQRGTTTVSGNGTSSATLFTQSGGLATRVIVNQLCMTFSSAVSGTNLVIGVYQETSGGQTSLIGHWWRNDTIGYRAVQFPVGAFTNNTWAGVTLGTAAVVPPTPVIGTTQAAGISGTSPGNVFINFSDSSNFRYAALPANFYIGPSDSITLRAQALDGSSNPVTVTIGYSFTTITES